MVRRAGPLKAGCRTQGRCDGWEAQGVFRRLELSLKASLSLFMPHAGLAATSFFSFQTVEARVLWFRTESHVDFDVSSIWKF